MNTTIDDIADILQERCGACCLDNRQEAERVAKEVIKHLVLTRTDTRWLRTLYLLGALQ